MEHEVNTSGILHRTVMTPRPPGSATTDQGKSTDVSTLESATPSPPRDTTFVGILRERASLHPSAICYRILDSGGTEKPLSYSELERKVDAIASRLHGLQAGGERVILLYPVGLDFVPAFLAVLAAGAIAVPAPLPRRRQRQDRLASILRDSGARFILTVASEMTRITESLPLSGESATMPIVFATDLVPDIFPAEPALPVFGSDRIALIQYTSGATSDPKGVVLTEAKLLQNCAMSTAAFGLRPDDNALTWLPNYHDMGLIGSILTPLYCGFNCRIMSPATFSRNPLFWLEAISKYRITVTGGPDFAYLHCLDRITPAQLAALDLSSWRVAFTGSETIRASTLRRFAAAFAISGFRFDAFRPCYGLAEATLIVTGGPHRAPLIEAFDAEGLSRGLVRQANGTEGSRQLVGCGEILPGETVLIVDPATGMVADQDALGEIWVDSPCNGFGYWQDITRSEFVFRARLPGNDGVFLRTGDLGFLHQGQLFVTGRLRDLVIIRGVNHFPQDLEMTCEEASNSIRRAGVAAFAIERAGREDLVIVAEIGRQKEPDDDDNEVILDCIRRHLSDAHGITPLAILLIREGALPRTTSGKIRRNACREYFEKGEFKPLARREWRLTPDPANHPGTILEASIEELGLDSLQRTALTHALEKASVYVAPEATVIDESSHNIAMFPEVQKLVKQRKNLATSGHRNPYFTNHEGIAAGTTVIDGRELINFASYNYLGLSGHPEVSAAACDAIVRYGTSVSASRLVSGNRPVHDELEQAISTFLGTGAALVFVGGHATNETTIGHLVGAGDLILHDRLAHNSIIEGAELSGARRWPFEHNDIAALERILDEVRARYRRVLIIVEGVYSMDGDMPDLRALCEVKERHRCLLMVDEAHSFGTMGSTGRGLTELCDVDAGRVDILMGTLSKSLASCGGFIAGSETFVDYLRYTAPGFVYSVGIPPAAAAAALAALHVMIREPGRLERLHERSRQFLEGLRRAGFATGLSSGTPVVPLITGSSDAALALSARLFAAGINAPPVLAPAVPEASARLRFFLSADHTGKQIRDTLEIIAQEKTALFPDVSTAP
jgi:8-amino-7-oxononanoate synthase